MISLQDQMDCGLKRAWATTPGPEQPSTDQGTNKLYFNTPQTKPQKPNVDSHRDYKNCMLFSWSKSSHCCVRFARKNFIQFNLQGNSVNHFPGISERKYTGSTHTLPPTTNIQPTQRNLRLRPDLQPSRGKNNSCNHTRGYPFPLGWPFTSVATVFPHT